MSKNNQLFDEFPPVSKEKWLEKVLKDLKGRPFEDLQWTIGENLTIDPFYHSTDNIEPTSIHRGPSVDNDWLIGEDFYIDNPIEDNKKLRSALENGVNAPRLIFNQAPSTTNLNHLFEGITHNYIFTSFKIIGNSPDYVLFLENYSSHLSAQNVDSVTLNGSIDLNLSNEKIDATLKIAAKLFPLFKCINLDLSHQENDISKIVDHLTETIQLMDQCLQKLEAGQVEGIQLTIQLGTSYFLEIAKLRAIKILWSNLLKAYQVPLLPIEIDAYIHPQSYDENANSNMIRSMTVAMSAVVGGVNRLTILPANPAEANSSTRIARNVQHILKMESYMNWVSDPAAGSFYIEKLTQLFSEQAWERFTTS